MAVKQEYPSTNIFSQMYEIFDLTSMQISYFRFRFWIQEYFSRHLVQVIRIILIRKKRLVVQLAKKNFQQNHFHIRSMEQVGQSPYCILEKREFLMRLMMSMGELLLIQKDYQLTQIPLLLSFMSPFLTGKRWWLSCLSISDQSSNYNYWNFAVELSVTSQLSLNLFKEIPMHLSIFYGNVYVLFDLIVNVVMSAFL